MILYCYSKIIMNNFKKFLYYQLNQIKIKLKKILYFLLAY